ncbi:hypothetical protein [Candidatus Methylobacter oryzae]|uniref:Uncharacterized protein n=1 Tax=Candidatus Methylobacter oryzae TaxID=2497749 RepID=A0ABY3C995_9GAMM|nr:hypothetical protein [Candidatus Methylobacter oryzae]TRW93320.1 hypothetical protein EKO24_012775 [Candidatus Methylobacter oryzae]
MNKKETIAKTKMLVDKVYPHFDKVILKADMEIDFNIFNVKKLTNLKSTKQRPPTIVKKDIKFQSPYYLLTLFQPSVGNLAYFCDRSAHLPINFNVRYAEVTYDFIGSDPLALATLVNAHLVHLKRGPCYYDVCEDTHYWGERKKNKCTFFPVSYCNISKIAQKPCFHFEYRMQGKAMCDQHLLSVPSDLIYFNFDEFFKLNTKFYVTPIKRDIGRAIALMNNHVITTDRGLEKRYDSFMKNPLTRINDPTVQKLLYKIPPLKQVLHGSKVTRKINQKFTESMQKALIKQ